jgi:hypothetical protein
LIRPFDRAQIFTGFLEAVLLGVAMEWLLDDEDVWSVKLEYWVKSAIIFDPTVGSSSNFSKSWFPWGSFGRTSRTQDMN